MKTNRYCNLWLAGMILLAAAVLPVKADDSAAIAELTKQLQALREEVATLKAAQAAQPIPTAGTTSPSATQPTDDSAVSSDLLGKDFLKVKGLTMGFYGESKYRMPEAGADAFDAHRYVLTPGYQINDWLVFNSELELEHGGVDESANNGRNTYDGEIKLEQFYVDILINEHINVRSLGISLIPVGRMNLYHEPTTFYSTERPELYREIIPSTWFEPSIGLFGKISDTLDYQLTVSSGMEDAIATSGSAASAATGRLPGYSSPGLNAAGGVRDARPRMRRADSNELGYSGRLHFSGIEGLDASTSFYVTQVEGTNDTSLITLWDIEALYRVPNTGLELRGDFAWWHITNPENLVANQNNVLGGASLNDDVGENMYGWYVEAAYHFWPEIWREGRCKEMDLVPFVRFTQIVTQSDLLPGSVELTNGTANRDFLTFGVAWFLSPHFVVKGDWRHNFDDSAASATSASSQDYFQIGVGMAF